MSDTMQINIDEGTLWLVRQTLRRNGRPNASADDAVEEIKSIIEETRNRNEEDRG
jgi:hypothetical protein